MKLDFNQIIEKFNQLDIKLRYVIFAALLVIVLVLDSFTFLALQLGGLKAIDTANQSSQQSIAQLKADLQRIDQMKAGLQNSRAQLEAVNLKIRPTGDVSSILEDMSKIANDGDIKIEQLNPQPELQQALITSGATKYYALPIVMKATSGYHKFGHFINQLESANLFFTLTNLTIENQVADPRHQTINATLKVVLSDKNIGGPTK